MTLDELEVLEHAAELGIAGSRGVALMPGELMELCKLARETLESRSNEPS